MRAALLLVCLLAAACTGRVDPLRPGAMPAVPSMGADLPAGGTLYANADLAELFTRLTLDMEWGATRPHLVRFEVPVRVSLEGNGSSEYRDFTHDLLGLLTRESSVDIGLAGPGDPANIHVRLVDGGEMERALPSQACIVVVGDTEWRTYLSDPPRYGGRSLVEADNLDSATIFIPRTSPPYQIRRCLIEEITQALGPANDMFGIADTIFNDDGAHGWPTRLDLLMLRVLYDPAMRTGLSRMETTARARDLLRRLNPDGENPGAARIPGRAFTDPYRWVTLNQQAHRAGDSLTRRANAAREALDQIARREPGSIRHCYSLGELGDLYARARPQEALGYYAEAERICARAVGENDVRIAQLRLHRAGVMLWQQQYGGAIALLEPLATVFAANGHEAALARLYAILGTAYLETGQDAKAVEALNLARDWGGYAFGTDDESVQSLSVVVDGGSGG